MDGDGSVRHACPLNLITFVFCVCREMVNAWFAERVHNIQPSSSKDNPPQQRSYQSSTEPNCPSIIPPPLTLLDNRCPSPATVPSPAPGTPTRKISASEFDRPLRPIVVKDSEGSLTFLSDTDRETVPLRGPVMGEGGAGVGGGNGKWSEGDRCARLLELVKDVSSHLDVTALCHKIFLHINELIAADRYSLFLVRKHLGTTPESYVTCLPEHSHIITVICQQYALHVCPYPIFTVGNRTEKNDSVGAFI